MRNNKSVHTIMLGRCSLAFSVLVPILLSACGGDESPTATPPPAANRAPIFSSANAVSVVENVTGSVSPVVANDPDGDALTYFLSGGADQGKFTVTATGALSFITPPNYDSAADADGDNVYQVQVSANDGKTTTALSIAITVTNLKEGVAVHRIATGFTDPVAIAPFSDTVALVAEKAGAIYQLNPQTGAKTLLVQIADVGGIGVTALVADASFSSKGSFFVIYMTTRGVLVVDKFVRNPGGPTVPAGPLLSVNAPQYAGGGWLGFDASNVLLVATGDAGGSGDPTGSAQDPASPLGKIIRFEPNPDPYAGASPVYFLPAVVGVGLHQPNGGSLVAGNILIADHGQDTAEEINLLAPGTNVRNYGWPFKEGTTSVRGTAPAGVADPIAEYFRGTTPRSGQAIIGGAMGPGAINSLKDKYIFADRSGAIFAIASSAIKQGLTLASATFERRDLDFVPDKGVITHPVAITAGPSASLYIVDAGGDIFRVDAG